jgi:hypothetical protein
MSSEFRAASQVPANKLYVNVAAIQSTIFRNDGVTNAAWVTDATALGMLSTAGAAVLRDMGKTVFLPLDGTTAQKSTVLRKVQLVFPAGAANTSVGGPATAGEEFMTGYIHIGGLTAGGTTEVFGAQSARVARLN